VEEHPPVTDVQRRRLLDAMAEIVGEEGYAAATVTATCARAGLSRQTFYQRFDGREQCFIAVLDHAYDFGMSVILRAFGSAATWTDGLREAFASLLVLFENRPALARLWIIESNAAGPWALVHRERNLATMTEAIVAHWAPPASSASHPQAVNAVMAAVVGVIQRHLATEHPGPLVNLLGSLMGIATDPFLKPESVANEIRRGDALAAAIADGLHQPAGLTDPEPEVDIPPSLLDPRAHRARAALFYLASNPGASNRSIADGIEINSHVQISRLLSRLEGMGLLNKRSALPGRTNAWKLSGSGESTILLLQESGLGAGDTSSTPADLTVTS
jgi:AcrR family transcriptional regulator